MVLLDRLRANWLRIVVHVGALVPLAWLAWKYSQGLFLVDPIREITTTTGKAALILLLLSLACTPAQILFGFSSVLRVRRALGLYAFLYAGLHFLTFIGLDYRFDLSLIPGAIFDQRYVLAGLGSGLILLLLALTSTRSSQMRLGRAWKPLHHLAYLAGILAVVHFMWLVKDLREPVRYGIVLVALLAVRLPPVRKALKRGRAQLKTRWRPQANPDVTT